MSVRCSTAKGQGVALRSTKHTDTRTRPAHATPRAGLQPDLAGLHCPTQGLMLLHKFCASTFLNKPAAATNTSCFLPALSSRSPPPLIRLRREAKRQSSATRARVPASRGAAMSHAPLQPAHMHLTSTRRAAARAPGAGSPSPLDGSPNTRGRHSIASGTVRATWRVRAWQGRPTAPPRAPRGTRAPP